MSASPIASLPAKQSPATEAPSPAQRKTRAVDHEPDTEGFISAVGFSQLLKEVSQTATSLANLPNFETAIPLPCEVLAAPQMVEIQRNRVLMANDEAWVAPSLTDQAVQCRDQQVEVTAFVSQGAIKKDNLPELMASDMTWALHSLVGQTARLDQSAEIAMRNGTHVQARLDAGLMAHASKAAWNATAQVPLVAQGVAVAAEGVMAQTEVAVASGAAALSLVSDAVHMVGDAVVDGLADGEGEASLATSDRGADGRVALQGAWTTPDRQVQPAEVMQRLLGQMSQFLSATGATEAAGLRRAGSKTGEEATAYQDGAVAPAGAGIGAGTGRLLDHAVAQAAASQQASGGDAQGAQADADMTYWMNARQQRAEVVLDRGGEPVRVQVTLEGQTAHVTFRSNEHATRAMLDASVAQLRDMLAAQGVELAGVQVDTQAGGGQQGGGSGAQERFMPEGARRMRLQTAEGLEQTPSLRGGSVSRQGVDIFA